MGTWPTGGLDKVGLFWTYFYAIVEDLLSLCSFAVVPAKESPSSSVSRSGCCLVDVCSKYHIEYLWEI